MGKSINQPHIEIGSDKDSCYVLSCPGDDEATALHPAAGPTGVNLEAVIDILRQRGVKFIPLRADATITNAWDKVESKDRTCRSEPDIAEVMDLSNLSRLHREIKSFKKYLICFGLNAAHASNTVKNNYGLKSGCRIIWAPHLSPKNVNKLKHDRFGGPLIRGGVGNTQKRLEVIADIIESQVR